MKLTRIAIALYLAGGALGSGLAARPAAAETTQCRAIPFLPHTITSPGVYCLAADLHTARATGSALEIGASNVVLDLNAHTLDGTAAGPSTEAVGIHAFGRQNVTIRNGTVRGFAQGIVLGDREPFTRSEGHVVDGVRVERSTLTGIHVSGRRSLIRHCAVVATGGAPARSPDATTHGVFVMGSEHRILDNDVITVSPGAGTSFGIRVDRQADNLVVGNRVNEATIGIDFAFGGDGKYRDNMVSSVGILYSGGTDAGGNN